MKSRPRSIERKVAEYLTGFYATRGWSPVERIPVLGRTGPDISINESDLVIDVKSRLEVPKFIFADGIVLYGDTLIGVRLKDIGKLYTDEGPTLTLPLSKLVSGYWAHMDEWRLENERAKVTCVILHRPGMPVKNSMVIISKTQKGNLWREEQPTL